MTPGARLSAAIGVLDRILAGEAAEKALTSWARASRYAGSADRNAVRDLVFDVLRRRRSCAAMGGAGLLGESGRVLVCGLLRQRGEDPSAAFSGEGHAPPVLTAVEAAAGRVPDGLAALDCPDWLGPELGDSLGPDVAPVLEALRHRAPVYLRVNLHRTDPAGAIAALAAQGITARPHPLASTALEVEGDGRRLHLCEAYTGGLVELQDAASQAVCERIPVPAGGRVLDFCAGGGGKSLALAARVEAQYVAHDADPRRMSDLPARAARAGAEVMVTSDPSVRAPYDLVLCDVPCSGSGAWRRSPEGKWRLSRASLDRLVGMQAAILDQAAALVAADGLLVYVTCSLLDAENQHQIRSFLTRTEGWAVEFDHRLTPLDGGDGFYLAVLSRGIARGNIRWRNGT